MDREKPWMRPVQYNEERPTQAPEVRLEAEEPEDGLASFPRVDRGSRDAVKANPDKRDKAPLNYRRGYGNNNEVFGDFDPKDEISEDAED